ncbi:MAG TPA: VanW family protein [Anaerolineae bacterium]|nr:VanW family protein [Anaerolineae bacterium]HOR00244.1 VanW family protein [Anaerolineae bacterium]HPL27758.1 VanW family protein [Anaerolineae bacterium]
MIETNRRVNSAAGRSDLAWATETGATLRATGRRQGGGPYRLLVGLLISLLTTVVVLGVAGLAWQQHYNGRVMPGVWVAGVPLQGLTALEAESALGEAWSTVGPRHLTLRDGDRQWVLPLEQVGITWDVQATVRAAMAVGRSGSFGSDWLARLRGMQRGVAVPPAWSFDEPRANLALRQLAKEIDQPARSATFELTGVTPRSEPATTGRELDVDATRRQMLAAVSSGLPLTLDLTVRTIEPAVADGEAARQQAEALLSRQVTVTFEEDGAQRAWSLSRDLIVRMIQPRQEAGADGLIRWVLDVKADPLAEWVAAIAREIDRPKLEGRVRIDPTTMLASISVPSQSGRTVDTAEALKRVLAALQGDEPAVQLPVAIDRPYITPEEVASWGRLNLLSEGTTSFRGSDAARSQNIVVGTSRFPGIVVPPGAIFSFNSYVGPITAAEGWAEGYVIMGDRTEPGIGGGLCQVATTCYRAAFFGGFPIVERYPHTYRVTWYEPPVGIDAAVFTPDVDMRFRNDLSIPIIIDSSADPATGKASFRFYGPGELGRTVEMEGPIITNQVKAPPPIYEDDPTLAPGQIIAVDSAHDGLRATVYRIIKVNGQVVSRETFVSDYVAWAARYRRGPSR